jgi:hypothetical protein
LFGLLGLFRLAGDEAVAPLADLIVKRRIPEFHNNTQEALRGDVAAARCPSPAEFHAGLKNQARFLSIPAKQEYVPFSGKISGHVFAGWVYNVNMRTWRAVSR